MDFVSRCEPGVQLRPRNAHQTAWHVQPQRPLIVFHCPEHRVARQPVSTVQTGDVAVFHSADSALCGSPERAFGVESQVDDTARGQSVGCCISLSHTAVPEPGGAAFIESQPQSNTSGIGDHRLRRILVPQCCPRHLRHFVLLSDSGQTTLGGVDPHVARCVLRKGVNVASGNRGHHESVVFQVSDRCIGCQPHTAARVLEECRDLALRHAFDFDLMYTRNRVGAPRPVSRNPTVLQPVQSVSHAGPDAAVFRCQYRAQRRAEKALF
jgi:hypothetical protein